jgi:hypothetical protein
MNEETNMRAKISHWTVAALVALVLGVTLGMAAPAHAWAWPVIGSCIGQAPNVEEEFYLGWGQHQTWGTPDAIWDGDIIQIIAVGVVKVDAWPWGSQYGPEGSGQNAPAGFPYASQPNAARYQLLTAFNGGTYSPWRLNECAQHFGRRTFLHLMINDNNVNDNGGGWMIRVRHYWTGS